MPLSRKDNLSVETAKLGPESQPACGCEPLVKDLRVGIDVINLEQLPYGSGDDGPMEGIIPIMEAS